jgi:hypothetical protein
VLAPLSAIRQLARALIQLSAAGVTTRNLGFLNSFPSLEPYIALSPALMVVQRMVEAARHRCAGRSRQQAWQIYRQILERTSQPDRAGLDESHHRHGTFGVKYGLGILEAGLGLPSSMDWAAEIESNPLYQVNAWTIRMVYHLWQGETREADRCRRKANLLRLQNRQRQFFEDSHIPTELAAHVAAGDLMKVKQSIARIEALASQYDGWKPILHYAVGEYHRLRGDNASALSELGAALSGPAGAEHQVWSDAAGSYLTTLLELGRVSDAVARGREYLAAVQKGYSCDTAIAELNAAGATGLCLAVAYRARARVAESAGDTVAQQRYAELSAHAFGPGVSPRLPPHPTAADTSVSEAEPKAEIPDSMSSVHFVTRSMILSSMERCRDYRERAHVCLEFLIKCSGAREGSLYVARAGRVTLAAQIGVRDVPAELERRVQQLLDELIQDDEEETRMIDTDMTTASRQEAPWLGPHGESYRVVPLSHRMRSGGLASGLALLAVDHEKTFIAPAQLASELGRFVLDDGPEDRASLTAPSLRSGR